MSSFTVITPSLGPTADEQLGKTCNSCAARAIFESRDGRITDRFRFRSLQVKARRTASGRPWRRGFLCTSSRTTGRSQSESRLATRGWRNAGAGKGNATATAGGVRKHADARM